MSINVLWDDSVKATVRMDIAGQWTWDEFYTTRQTVYTLMDTAQHNRVFTVAYFTDHKVNIPPGAMNHLRQVVSYQHPKAGLTIVVGASRTMKTVFAGFKRAAALAGRKVDFSYVDTLTEARKLTEAEHHKRNGIP